MTVLGSLDGPKLCTARVFQPFPNLGFHSSFLEEAKLITAFIDTRRSRDDRYSDRSQDSGHAAHCVECTNILQYNLPSEKWLVTSKYAPTR